MSSVQSNLSLTMGEKRENEVPITISQSTFSTRRASHDATLTSRRNEPRSWPRHRQLFQTSHLLLFVFLTCCLTLTSASVYIEESMVEVEVKPEVPESFEESLDRLAKSGTILVDQNPPPNPKAWTLATEHDDLQRRDNPSGNQNNNNARSSSSSSMITIASSASSTKSSSSEASGTASSLVTAATDSSSPLPVPFDQGFSNNITESCSDFMYGFLKNGTFQACNPFSLLLQSSNSFFQASKSILRITQTLDSTCSANLATCSTLMTALADNITEAANCASDLQNENPLIQQAHLGLLAYKPLYTASCLRNPKSNAYCFAEAVTNATSPTDSYIYYLPLNISLPGGSQPTCSTCLKNTMAVFGAASSDRSSALASDYVGAAQQVNLQCGPGFVNQSLAPASSSASGLYSPPMISNAGVLALAVLVGSWLL